MSFLPEKRSISQDEYGAWKNSPVTQRFMLEVANELESVRQNNTSAYSSSIEQIALAYREKAVECAVYEDILSWIPDELIVNES